MVTLDLREEAEAALVPVADLPHLRDEAVRQWRARMATAGRAARALGSLPEALMAAGADPIAASSAAVLARRARRDAVTCAGVIASLGGEPVVEVVPFAAPGLASVLVAMGCLEATLGATVLHVLWLDAVPGALRDVVGELHASLATRASFAWRTLRRMAESETVEVPDLPVLLAAVEANLLAALPVRLPPEAELLGLMDASRAGPLLLGEVAEGIVPGLDALGLPAGALWSSRVDVA